MCPYKAGDLTEVFQKWMRHASATTTLDRYANEDAAVEEAVLARNSPGQPKLAREDENAACSCGPVADDGFSPARLLACYSFSEKSSRCRVRLRL